MQPQPIETMIGNLANGFLFANIIHGLTEQAGKDMSITVSRPDGSEVVTKVPARRVPSAGSASSHEYHLVSILGNQAYFGKFQVTQDQRFVRLTDVYYLAPNQNNARDLRLIKAGQEIHGPEDLLTINMTYVILWQRLTDEAPVVQAILASKQ